MDRLFLPMLASLVWLSACLESETSRTVRFEGRIVEAFDSNKPLDSVLVEGCLLLVAWKGCVTETLTNDRGYFDISFEAELLEAGVMSYSKPGFESLDSCITLKNGTIECYMEALPTVFEISSPIKYYAAFYYDSVHVQVVRYDIDTTILRFFQNQRISTTGESSYRWETNDVPSSGTFNPYIPIAVPDNSYVMVEASYYKNDELAGFDTDTLFCKRGIGNMYRLSNE